MEKAIVGIFALFVLLNEIILKYDSNIGAVMYLALMSLALIILSRQDILDKVSQMIIILLVVPLVRIAGLFIDLPYIWKISVGSGILLFLGLYYFYKFDLDIGNFSKHLGILPIVLCMGAVIGIFGNFLFSGSGSLILIAILPLVVFSEEIFFRGLIQNSIEKSCGVFYSLVIPSVIYGALSIYLGVGLAGLFFLVSFLSGIIYFSTKNLFLSVVFNLAVSVFIFVIPSLV